jgi:hypothetical protein
MFAEVDVFISNYTLVDPEVYQLWVDGCSCKYGNESNLHRPCSCCTSIVADSLPHKNTFKFGFWELVLNDGTAYFHCDIRTAQEVGAQE